MRPRVLLLIVGLGLLLATQTQAADPPRRPNVIFILADDLGYGELGCYGQTKIKTPHLDRLAAEGMRFTQAYAGSRVCQPSRSVLMTGQHTGHTPIRANDANQMLADSDTTIAEIFKQAGYATGAFGKWGLGYEGTPGHPNRQGFDEFFGSLLQVHAHFYYPYWVWHNDAKYPLPGNEGGRRKQYVQDEMHAKALDFIRTHKDQPFFAYLPYIIPHVELVVPEESERPYRGQFPKRAILDPRAKYIGSEDGLTTLAGMISRLDAQVGEVMALLKELGLDENTLVFFSSDNGAQSGGKDNGWTYMTDYFRGNGPLRGYKGTWYEGGLRVPLLARWPGRIPAGTTSDHVCGFQDVLPTLAEIVGVEPPKNLDGISIVPTLLRRGEQRQHEGLYWEYPLRNGQITRAARIGQWKAIQQRPGADVELYDLATDLSEQRNVAAQHPEIVQRIVAFMDAEHRPPRAFPQIAPRATVDDFVR